MSGADFGQPIEIKSAELEADDYDYDYEDWEYSCDHEHDDACELEGCHHEHCFNCGECGCPGYCDDYQTYNLRPGETGGTDQ